MGKESWTPAGCKNKTNPVAMEMYLLKYNVNYPLQFPLLTTDSYKSPIAHELWRPIEKSPYL